MIFLELLVISVISAFALSLPGNFIVLRKMSLLVFGLTHALVFGIAIAYVLIGDFFSPWLIISASITGLLIVIFVQFLSNLEFVNEDAALGLVYITVFALGVIIISKYADNATFSLKSIFTGNFVLAPFDRYSLFGYDIGPKTLWLMLIFLIINIVVITLIYKELKITSFDPEFAQMLGYKPVIINYILLSIVSLTVVGAFRSLGIIIVMALMIIPPATAYLLTNHLTRMIFISTVIAFLSSTIGFLIAWNASLSIGGMISTVAGIIFFIVLIFSPRRGMLSDYLKLRKIKKLEYQPNKT